ncbi:MAG: gamma-glutamyl-phosphate reductase, partial [Planctomycetota bacterium]
MTTAPPTPAPGIADVPAYCLELAQAARKAALALTAVPGRVRDDALRHTADALIAATETIKAANAKDLAAGRDNGLASAMLDRLALDDARIANMADAVRQIADQPDPVGRILDGRVLPNGIQLSKVRVPLGTVLIIFESRPNVTCDAAALCLKSGNAAVLRGGKEALHSN